MPNQPGQYPANFRSGQHLPTAAELQSLSKSAIKQIVGGRGIKVTTFGDRVVIEARESRIGNGLDIRRFRVHLEDSDYLECDWIDGDGTDLNPSAYYYLAKPLTLRTLGAFSVGDVVMGVLNVGATGVEVDGTPCHWEVLASSGAGSSGWTVVSESAYTSTPASTSRITMSDVSSLKLGAALRCKIGGVYYYGVVDDLVDDSYSGYIDVMGAPLSGTIEELAYGKDDKLQQIEFFVGNQSFQATSNTLLSSIMKTSFRWRQPKAFLVGFSGILSIPDATAGPRINVRVDGNNLSTESSSEGIQVTNSWVDNSLVAINPNVYEVERDSAIELACTRVGTAGDAAHLTVSCLFVLE